MKTAADKKRKRAAKQRPPSADRHEAVHEERKLLALQIEYPTSNLEDILSIARRFRERYDALVDNGHFQDLESELQEAMRSAPREQCLVASLDFKIYDYNDYLTPMPIGRSLLRFRSDEEMGVHRDTTFVQKFLIGYHIVAASSEVCPACGAEWKHKVTDLQCPHCAQELGEDMYFFIENDRCPHCNREGITESGMVCKGCKQTIPEGTYILPKE